MDIKIQRKPDDHLEAEGGNAEIPVLRASMGGNPVIGFYLVYRGDPKDIIHMITMVQSELVKQYAEGVVHPIEPEDGQHR